MTSLNGDELGTNRYLDMVYQLSIRQSERPVPVGVVLKNNRLLLDHHHILRKIQQSMANRLSHARGQAQIGVQLS